MCSNIINNKWVFFVQKTKKKKQKRENDEGTTDDWLLMKTTQTGKSKASPIYNLHHPEIAYLCNTRLLSVSLVQRTNSFPARQRYNGLEILQSINCVLLKHMEYGYWKLIMINWMGNYYKIAYYIFFHFNPFDGSIHI